MTVYERPLSTTEHFFRSRTAVGYYRNFQLVATYSKDVLEEHLFKALRKTVIDYHLLVCNVQKTNDNCHYVPLERVYFKDIVEMRDLDHVSQEYMQEVDKIRFQLYTDKPLFKVYLLGVRKVNLVFEHSICDGVAGVLVHQELLDNLAYVENNPEEYDRIYGAYDPKSPLWDYQADKHLIKIGINPPIDDFLPDYNIDHTDGDPNHYSKIIPEAYPDKWTGRVPSHRDLPVEFFTINFTPDEVRRILKTCKAKKISMTSLILLVHAWVLQPVLGTTSHSTHNVAMNLRRHIPIEVQKDRKILGTMAHMGLNHKFAPFEDVTWEMVQQANDRIQQSAANVKVHHMSKAYYDSQSLVDDNEAFFTKFVGQPRPDAVKLSNVGLVVAKKGDWEIVDMLFYQDIAVVSSEFMLSVVSTPKGGMNMINTVVSEPPLEIERFMEKVKEKMMAMVEG